MRNLDLKRFCVQEMNAMEMLEIDGGGLWKDIKDFFRGYYDAVFCFK